MKCCYDFEVNGTTGRFLDTETKYYEDGEHLYFEFGGNAKSCIYKRQMSDEIFIDRFLSRTQHVSFYYNKLGNLGRSNILYIGSDYEKVNGVVVENTLYVFPKSNNIRIFYGDTFKKVSPTEYEICKSMKFHIARGRRKYRVLKKYNMRRMALYGV